MTDTKHMGSKTLPLKAVGGIKKSPPQPKKKEEILSHIKILEERYPKLFDRNNPKPLKIKIHEDILTFFKEKPAMTPPQLRDALRFYTRNPKYLLSIAQSDVRYDLNGDEDGHILQEHKTDANEKLSQKNKLM